MAKIHHIFGGIAEHELDGILDESGFVTTQGQKLLRKIGVETEKKVSIGKTTIKNLFVLYNGWKTPKIPIDPETELIVGNFLKIPEDDTYLLKKWEILEQSFNMGIKIGEGTRIGEDVGLGLGVSVGRYCEVSDLCELCIFSTIHDRVYLGKSAHIGKDSDVKSGSRVMARAVVAERTIVKENSLIAEGIVFKDNKKY